jgi:hypothetical protein
MLKINIILFLNNILKSIYLENIDKNIDLL